ncbi:MAG: response regulator transcription factor [Acidobacteria bacterium]|nr:response regulator transcription factor [Acidobacteriota bacterium]
MKQIVILVADDDRRFRSVLAAELEAAGYRTLTAEDGSEAFDLFETGKPDLVISDLAMPVVDGFDLIERVRRSSAVPILVLSVRGADADKIRALDLGADDFVTKPFSLPELFARIRAQLRRAPERASKLLKFQDLAVDLESRQVVQGERLVRLTPTEFDLLAMLAGRAGKPVTLDQIVSKVWKSAPGTTFDTVRVHIRSLRKKLEPDPNEPRYIVTEPWVGYRFIAEPLD